MGTVSQFHESLRPPAHRIESEEEAISTARDLAAAFRRQASERDINRILPFAELDALSVSGLTAIAVPPDHEGLDVSNALLAEIVAIIAEGDASIGEALENHFCVLETLRTQAAEDLKASLFARVLLGDRFSAATFTDGAELTAEGPGYRLSGRTRQAPGILFADWIAAAATAPPSRPVTLYLARDDEGVQVVDDWDGFGQRTNGSATAIVGTLHVNADAIAPAPSSGYSTGISLGLLLKGWRQPGHRAGHMERPDGRDWRSQRDHPPPDRRARHPHRSDGGSLGTGWPQTRHCPGQSYGGSDGGRAFFRLGRRNPCRGNGARHRKRAV